MGEPKSPHGVDVTPDGKELVVSGKLDTHATVYSFEKIKGSDRAAKKFAGTDPYGVPILPFEEAIRGAGRARPSGRCTRSSTTRATPIPRCSSSPRW